MTDDREALEDSPICATKSYEESSVFTPESLIREARRQKGLPETDVPSVCVLEPDGDLVSYLIDTGTGSRSKTWPGYHTDLVQFDLADHQVGIVGCAVGAPFAVLVAEQLFATGCEYLISVTSSGQIVPRDDPPYFVLIDRALRDEGTSHHYRPPGRFSCIESTLRDRIAAEFDRVSRPVYVGASWTTDAPFRETLTAIDCAKQAGIMAVEMEAAALYTLGAVRSQSIACFAHVTNRMGQVENDFEKGTAGGGPATLEVIEAAIVAWVD